MTHTRFFVAALLGAVIGCAATQMTRSAPATAQPGTSGLSECVSYTLGFDGDYEDLAGEAKDITGWTPVGGTTANGGAAVILCR